MNDNPASVLENAKPARLETRVTYARTDEAGKPAATDKARSNDSLEYEAAKWFGPWTVLINRRTGGSLFRTAAR